ncbi:hypothetical protein [Archangium sp.]|uniref:hypothetical protein n=1 Tax=Archangium sp. TaxID=1872627 RepID=UPI002D763C2C|nr:hypothetical protein [Archangium sp.]HYO53460.1 hypothetical protein [Archangium sp.]
MLKKPLRRYSWPRRWPEGKVLYDAGRTSVAGWCCYTPRGAFVHPGGEYELRS